MHQRHKPSCYRFSWKWNGCHVGGGKGLESEEERKKEEKTLKLPQIKGFASVFRAGEMWGG